MDYRNPIHHSMLRRAHFWDYRDPRIYMITLTLANRRRPLLGNLVIDSKPGVSPEEVRAHIVPSALGQSVQEYWQTIPKLHPQIQMYALQLMEEHLHGILHVKERLEYPLGHIIGNFKGICTLSYRQFFPHDPIDRLFSHGFQDTILTHRGQLNRMRQYLLDNPRRAAIKRLFPNLFRSLRQIPFGPGAFTGLGNLFLLERSLFHQVQVSRHTTDEALETQRQEMLRALTDGAVVVSPCISPGERELARSAFNCQAPLIVLQNKGFAPLYKPPGAYFDACAAGRLLMLAPSQWPYQPGKKPMTREDACILNALAQEICGKNATEIHYNGIVPANLSELVIRAMRPPN